MVGPDYVRPTVDTPACLAHDGRRGEGRRQHRLVGAVRRPGPQRPDRTARSRRTRTCRSPPRGSTSSPGDTASSAPTSSRRSGPCCGRPPAHTARRGTPSPPGTNITLNSYSAVLNASWEIDIWGRIRRADRGRPRGTPRERGGPAGRHPLAGRLRRRRLHQPARPRPAAGDRQGDGEDPRGIATRSSSSASRAASSPRLELRQVKSQYEEALATIPPVEKAIAQQENALSVLLGRNPGPIPRGKTIDQLTLPADPRRAALGSARAPARHPPGRAEPDRRQCPDRRREGRVLLRPSR